MHDKMIVNMSARDHSMYLCKICAGDNSLLRPYQPRSDPRSPSSSTSQRPRNLTRKYSPGVAAIPHRHQHGLARNVNWHMNWLGSSCVKEISPIRRQCYVAPLAPRSNIWLVASLICKFVCSSKILRLEHSGLTCSSLRVEGSAVSGHWACRKLPSQILEWTIHFAEDARIVRGLANVVPHRNSIAVCSTRTSQDFGARLKTNLHKPIALARLLLPESSRWPPTSR
jgi:hypothetical protein